MRTLVATVSSIAILTALLPLAAATHECKNQPAVGGTIFWVPTGGEKCVGAAVGLGFEFQCARSVGAIDAGAVWVSIVDRWGCQTGAAVALPLP